MPKLTTKATKKATAAEDMRAFGPIFNKDLGQHILKNPLVAQGIVDKVTLAIDTRTCDDPLSDIAVLIHRPTSLAQIQYWKLVLVPVT